MRTNTGARGMNVRTFLLATLRGHFNCLMYAYDHHCPYNLEEVVVGAVANKRINYLFDLHERGFPFAPIECSSAATIGHLTYLQYAHEHGCTWDAGTCSSAAMSPGLPAVCT
jgi:hypothetical protein